MIVCIFGRVQWRWALNDRLALGLGGPRYGCPTEYKGHSLRGHGEFDSIFLGPSPPAPRRLHTHPPPHALLVPVPPPPSLRQPLPAGSITAAPRVPSVAPAAAR
jgi:hypothetical protein